MFSFALPLPPVEFTVSLMWHPRLQADPAHRWLRACVREICGSDAPQKGQTLDADNDGANTQKLPT